MYFEVKVNIERNGKIKSEVYVAQTEDFIHAEPIVSAELGSVETTGVNKKNYVEVFDEAEKSHFFECKVAYDDIDGKAVKEMYLQKADELEEAKNLLLGNIENEPEFKSVRETNIMDFIKSED